jgi:hypothetical protein
VMMTRVGLIDPPPGRESTTVPGRGRAGPALTALPCPPMAAPYSLDEQGRPMPTYPCPRPNCGRAVSVRFKGFRVGHLKHVGWEAYRVESYQNWCGHTQEVTRGHGRMA